MAGAFAQGRPLRICLLLVAKGLGRTQARCPPCGKVTGSCGGEQQQECTASHRGRIERCGLEEQALQSACRGDRAGHPDREACHYRREPLPEYRSQYVSLLCSKGNPESDFTGACEDG